VKRFLELVFAGVVASVVLACQDEITAPVANILMDAGRTLVDAGTSMLDGGHEDAANGDASGNGNGDGDGDPRSDSGTVADASAQAPCGACTVAGPIEVQTPLNVVTADTDVARLRSGVIDPAAGWTQLVAGPFVVTDVHPAAVTASTSAGSFVELATAEPGDCATRTKGRCSGSTSTTPPPTSSRSSSASPTSRPTCRRCASTARAPTRRRSC
jgi:hypothetical protein